MLELIGWNVGMNLGEAVLLVAGALVIGAIAQYIGRPGFGYDWLFTAAAALVGGWIGSEAFGTLSTWGPAFDGLYLLPALIGAVVLGGVVDALSRTVAGGTYAPNPV
ncbi:MAG TPA: GlsB/YeaQ/YmgE family stress response membrane protein [Candidatus Limnocylindria bacterium]|jgi:uncharacterized membrane protein YeaQ/YmgE (transglycosylase-associated protein family)|nr:GlsB/YeaQ/YmgE family stress response membrane protein [Candidatus Limnocylindria bacterium]